MHVGSYQYYSIDPPLAPSGVMTTHEQYSKTGASIYITWIASRRADNYTIEVTPPVQIMPGQMSQYFTTTNTSLQLMLEYNVNYSINITAQNCVGSTSTSLVPLIIRES